MSSDVIPAQQAAPTTSPALQVAALVSWKPDGGERWILRRPLTEAERSTLFNEFQAAEQRLKTADRDKARQIVANMLAGFAGANRTDAEHEAELKRYEFAVAGFPAWAIVEACGAFMRGEIEREQHRFAPTPAEMSVVLRRIVQPLRARWYDLRELLRAEAEAPPEERARNVGRVKDLLRGFAGFLPKPTGGDQ